MKDERKTKAQLIEELNLMREKVKSLETKIESFETKNQSPDNMFKTRAKRNDLHTNIELATDFDIIEARGMNISEGGICFEIYEDLPFKMRFEHDGIPRHHRANLVWIKKLPVAGFRFGMMFNT